MILLLKLCVNLFNSTKNVEIIIGFLPRAFFNICYAMCNSKNSIFSFKTNVSDLTVLHTIFYSQTFLLRKKIQWELDRVIKEAENLVL